MASGLLGHRHQELGVREIQLHGEVREDFLKEVT